MDVNAHAADLPMAELLGSLSLATDLGTGQPLGHALRTCMRSVGIARQLGLDDEAIRDIHQVALLRFIGCTADASDTASLTGGDNLAFVAAMAPVVMGSQREQLQRFARSVGAGLPPPRRARRLAAGLADPGGAGRSLSAHCEVAARFGQRIGVGSGVLEALAHAYERWDGRGFPDGLAGQDVPLAIRIVTVARDLELLDRVAPDDADDVVAVRRGRAYDPSVVDAALACRGDRQSAAPVADVAGEEADVPLAELWEAARAAEPSPVRLIGAEGLDAVLEVVADVADLYSPWCGGRSGRVAAIVRDAAVATGSTREAADELWRAALLQDVGRIAVPAGIWNHPGPLGAAAWHQVRLHPFVTERVLACSSALRRFSELSASHHERLDGSGYHRGARSATLSASQRLLAAADVLVALGEARPHRHALASGDREDVLRDEVRVGRLHADAVDAVCAVAGHVLPRGRRTWPCGLTDREVDVLRLISRGRTNREVAVELHLSAKTVGRHVENLYLKIGVSSRAAAALFAMEQRLLDPG